MQRPRNPYSSAEIDRASHEREDDERMIELASSGAARFVPIDSEKNLVKSGGSPEAVFLQGMMGRAIANAAEHPIFLGYVEGHDLFHNRVDVVVCDGFVGNIVLKTCESLARGMFAMLKRELTANPKRKLGALLAKNAFRAIKRRTDSENYGGAPLLGLNGVVFKAHASARERSILNAIRVATETLEFNVNQAIAREEIGRASCRERV